MQVAAYAHDQVAEVFKAVADATRVRMLALLAHAGECCVCHVEAVLGVTQSRASRHLATLRRAGLVQDRRDGAWVYYRIPKGLDPVRRAVVSAIRAAFADDPQTISDVRRAAAIGAAAEGCGGTR